MAQYYEMFQGKKQAFTIRNGVGDDAEAIIRCIEQADRETTFLAREPGEFSKSMTPEKERKYLEGRVEDPAELFLVAALPDGEIAGTCGCSFSRTRARARHKASLGIMVRKDFWRQGLGRRLMEIQEAWCRQNGVEKICLEVDASNLPAVSLYLRQGFVVEGTLRQEAKLADGSYRDFYTMAKFLK